jgi:hypothetical protein
MKEQLPHRIRLSTKQAVEEAKSTPWAEQSSDKLPARSVCIVRRPLHS